MDVLKVSDRGGFNSERGTLHKGGLQKVLSVQQRALPEQASPHGRGLACLAILVAALCGEDIQSRTALAGPSVAGCGAICSFCKH